MFTWTYIYDAKPSSFIDFLRPAVCSEANLLQQSSPLANSASFRELEHTVSENAPLPGLAVIITLFS